MYIRALISLDPLSFNETFFILKAESVFRHDKEYKKYMYTRINSLQCSVSEENELRTILSQVWRIWTLLGTNTVNERKKWVGSLFKIIRKEKTSKLGRFDKPLWEGGQNVYTTELKLTWKNTPYDAYT